MPSEEWTGLFARLAHHLPGLGGPQGFNMLTYDEVQAILDYMIEDQRAREEALRK